MKIVVAVKQVATLDDEFEIDDDGITVDADFIEWDLNEWDSFAVEEALRLRDAAGDGEVVVVSVGGEQAVDALRTCLAMGADRAVLIGAEDETSDPLSVARLLASMIERETPDLVFAGVQSSDSVFGATGIATAGFLGMPHVAVVKALEFEPGSNRAILQRELEGGVIERVEVTTPALLTIQTGINQPRYANLRAIKQAAAHPIEELSALDLGLDRAGLDAVAGASVRRVRPPERGAGATMIEGSPAEIAERIVEIVEGQL